MADRWLLGIGSSSECDPVTDDRADGERDSQPAQENDGCLGRPTHALIIGCGLFPSLSPKESFEALPR
jgi:hypothetical protein